MISDQIKNTRLFAGAPEALEFNATDPG